MDDDALFANRAVIFAFTHSIPGTKTAAQTTLEIAALTKELPMSIEIPKYTAAAPTKNTTRTAALPFRRRPCTAIRKPYASDRSSSASDIRARRYGDTVRTTAARVNPAIPAQIAVRFP